MRKRYQMLYLIGVLLLLVFLLAACGKKESQLSVDVTIGFDHSVKVASENPVTVSVTNNGKEFSGEIQCIINKNSGESIIYAKEIQVPQGSTKEIHMMIPFYTIQKKVDFRVVSKGKRLYQEDIAVNKFISPNQPIVAVISDQPDNYRYLNSIRYNYFNKGNTNEYYNQMQSQSTPDQEVEVIEPIMFYFDTFEEISRFENYEFFNYMFIGDNKNLVVNEATETKLLNWINKGNTLLFETGEDYQKLYSFLPKSITNFNVETIETINQAILTMTMPFSHAIGAPIDMKNTFVYEVDGITIGLYTQIGQGQIVNVLIDLSSGLYKNWQFKSQIYDEILAHGVGGQLSLAGATYQDPNFIGNNLSDILNYIPNEKKPPYGIISLLLGIYIIFVGPILYLVLKQMDKRDYMWAAIPGSALFIILLLYVFGFGTRYEKPIMNSVSAIDFVDGENRITVNTRFSIFNNKSGDLNIDWNNNEKIDLANDYNYYGNTNGAVPEISGKITESNRMKYSIYSAPLWSKYDFDTSKVLPLEINQENKFVTFKLEGDNIFVTLTNKTPFDLTTAYMQWGTALLYIGELNGYETKEYAFKKSDLFYDFYSFTSNLRGKYNLNFNNYSDDNIMNSNLNLFERISNNYNNGIVPQTGIDKITIKGINTSDIGYDVKVNESDVERFNRNIISIDTKVDFESGTQLSIPENFVMPSCYAGISDGNLSPRYASNNYDGNINLSIYEDTIVEFDYLLPTYLDIQTLELSVYPMYLEEDFYEKNGLGGQIQPIQNVTYEIFNVKEQVFEAITKLGTQFIVDKDTYTDAHTGLKLRVTLTGVHEDTIKYSGKVIQLPALAIEGKVK